MKFKNISIVSLFLSGIVLTFLFCSVSIVVLAVSSIRKIDKILSSNVSHNLYERKADTLLEKVKLKAMYYNSIFQDAVTFADVLEKQVNALNKLAPFYRVEDLFSAASSLSFDPDKRIFFNNPRENPRIYYWGRADAISAEIYGRIHTMMILKALMKSLLIDRIVNPEAPYFAAFIANERDHFLIDYFYNPNIGELLKPPTREIFEKYYSTYNIQKNGWTDVYKDITGYFLTTTYRLLHDDNGNVVGRTGIDISVDYILKELEDFHIESYRPDIDSAIFTEIPHRYSRFSFIIKSSDSELIAFPESRLGIFGLAPRNLKKMEYQEILDIKLTDSKFEGVRNLYNYAIKGENNHLNVEIEGREYLFIYSTIPVNGWILCSLVPSEELITSISSAQKLLGESSFVLILNLTIFGILYATVCLVIIALAFRKIMIMPISNLELAVKQLMKGDFGVKVKNGGAKEISDVISSFNFLSNNLAKYSGDVKDKISKRLYVENEVNIAKQIQAAVLPNANLSSFSNFDVDISGKVISTELISSAFYDYFLISKDKIAFFIGEVSGRNISAAFYMMVTKTLLKDICMKYPNNPAEVLDEVNRILCEKYNVDMFISLALVFYDEKHSNISYSFAGFVNMFKISPSSYIEEVSGQRSPALGLIIDAFYRFDEKTLIPKSKLFVFTRGMMDSINMKGEPYSLDRVSDLFKGHLTSTAEECCNIVAKDIKDFGDVNKEDKAVLVFSRKSSDYELSSVIKHYGN